MNPQLVLRLGIAASTLIQLRGTTGAMTLRRREAQAPGQMDADSRAMMEAQSEGPLEAPGEHSRRDRLLTQPDLPQVDRVAELEATGPHGPIPVRVYHGAGTADLAAVPAHVYFHGGGWTAGDLDSHDWTCRSIANAARCAVVNVAYRVAPEHAFPAAFDDALAATRWVAAQPDRLRIDPARVSIGGDGAGGNLAAAVALALRDGNEVRIRAQALLYPAVDLSREDSGRFPSGVLLTDDGLRAAIEAYVPDAGQRSDWRASPLLASSLAGLPPTLLVLAGLDPLAAQGEAYAERLASEGVPVVVKRYPGQMHGFVSHAKLLRRAYDAIDDVAEALRANG
jgi:acetyl esterase